MKLSVAQAASQLDKEKGTKEEVLKAAVEQLERELNPFILPSHFSTFRKDILIVLKTALELQIVFMKSRAVFRVSLPPFKGILAPMEANNETMEIAFTPTDLPDHELTVDFVVSPALEKFGNADGEAFHLKSVLCKSHYVAKAKGASRAADDSGQGSAALDPSRQEEQQLEVAQPNDGSGGTQLLATCAQKNQETCDNQVSTEPSKACGRTQDRAKPRSFSHNQPQHEDAQEIRNQDDTQKQGMTVVLNSSDSLDDELQNDSSSTTTTLDKQLSRAAKSKG